MAYRLESTLISKEIEPNTMANIPVEEFEYTPILGCEYEDFDEAMSARKTLCEMLENTYVRIVEI